MQDKIYMVDDENKDVPDFGPGIPLEESDTSAEENK